MLYLSGILILVLIALLLTLFLLSPGKPKPITDANGITLKNSISEKVFVDINGSRQGLFIKGENTNLPVMLYLHGGMSDYFLTEKYPTGPEKNFIMVWWEQRGCGISYNADNSSTITSVEQLVDDTITLTRYLLNRFNKQKIYLMAHSGGTFIGIYVIDKNPELYNAYIALSQMSAQRSSEKLAYNYMLNKYRETGNRKMTELFNKMNMQDNRPLPDEYTKVRDIAMHELGVGTMRSIKNIFTDLILPSLIFSEYTIHEKFYLWAGKARSGISQNWKSMMDTNLMEHKNSFNLPVYFFHGRYDYTCSYELAKEYFKKITAPLKGFYTFENSAHSPLFEEPAKMNKILSEDVVKSQINFTEL